MKYLKKYEFHVANDPKYEIGNYVILNYSVSYDDELNKFKSDFHFCKIIDRKVYQYSNPDYCVENSKENIGWIDESNIHDFMYPLQIEAFEAEKSSNKYNL